MNTQIIYISPVSDLQAIETDSIASLSNDATEGQGELSQVNEQDSSGFLGRLAKSFKNLDATEKSLLISLIPFGSVLWTSMSVASKIAQAATPSDSDKETKESERLMVEKETEVLTTELKFKLSQLKYSVTVIPYSDIPENYEFPPGHPQIGSLYLAHPLKSKNQFYIPYTLFDSLLYSERENELMRILVDLGATEIEIQELASGKIEGSVKAGGQIQGAGGVETDIRGETQQSNKKSRVIKLRGKNWEPDMNFNKTQYSWLPFEPAWESLVYARLEGGCIESSIELTSETLNSISAQLGLTDGLLKNIGSLETGAGFSMNRQEKKLFKVKFADALPDSKKDP